MSGFSQADAERVGFNAGQTTNTMVESAREWEFMDTVRGKRAAAVVAHVAEDAYRAMDAYAALYAEKQAEADRIAADLAKLENPLPGTVVRGEGPMGPFVATLIDHQPRDPSLSGWSLKSSDAGKYEGAWGISAFILPFLAALVSSGEATVESPVKEDAPNA